jgi:MFS family permease
MSAAGTVFLLCVAEVLTMTGVAIYPALLPELRAEWSLSNTQAGLIGGAFFGGYMMAVPVLVALTDRMPARTVHAGGCALLFFGSAGFALLADGLWSAALSQAISGVGLAGTYMPGLKELSDRVTGPRQSRAIAFYTSTFGIGTSLSLVIAGKLGAAAGWRAAFGWSAIGPAIAAALLFLFLKPIAAPGRVVNRSRALLDFRPVWENARARSFVLGYAAHCWELFGLRSWMVACFAYVASRDPSGLPWNWTGPALASTINLLGPVASILGNEAAAGRRRRTVVGIMVASGSMALMAGVGVRLPAMVAVVLIAVYFLAIMSDSAALTAGLIEASESAARGAAMAVHSFAGFAAGLGAPVVVGLALDLAGGEASPAGWMAGFATLAAVSWAGAAAVFLGSDRGQTRV